MLSKTDAIEAILRRNPTVRGDFLEDFSAGELRAYLERLNASPDRPWEVELEATESPGVSAHTC